MLKSVQTAEGSLAHASTSGLDGSIWQAAAKAPARAPLGLVTEAQQVVAATGLVPGHLPLLLALAVKKKYVIAFRPVEKLATRLIEEGHPTKNLHIKGKSSDWGPMAGFIPVDQALSKLRTPEEIARYNQQIVQCLDEGRAERGQLILSDGRLQELKDKGLITMALPAGDDDTRIWASSPPDRSGTEFKIKKTEDGRNAVFRFDGSPLDVLYPKLPGDDPTASSKPLTADYDLLLVAPRAEDFGEEDRPRVGFGIQFDSFKKLVEGYGRRSSAPALPEGARVRELPRNPLLLQMVAAGPKAFYAQEHPDMGNVSKRVMALIPELNSAVGCAPGREVVHHNMDANSPATDPAANYPATIFLPEPINGLPLLMVAKDEEALRYVLATVMAAGFNVPLNPLWPDALRSLRNPQFSRALDFFKNR